MGKQFTVFPQEKFREMVKRIEAVEKRLEENLTEDDYKEVMKEVKEIIRECQTDDFIGNRYFLTKGNILLRKAKAMGTPEN